jgi:hypothetical protein
MVNVLKWPVLAVMCVVAIILVLMPYGGLLFLCSLVVSGALIGLQYFDLYEFSQMDWVVAFLGVAWKVYLGFAIFTLWIMVTFSFQHCCVGLNTFKNHVLHYRVRHAVSLMIFSILWPYSICMFDRNMRGWMMSWLDVAGNAIEYWVPLSWFFNGRSEGVEMKTINMQTGEIETNYVRSPEEGHDALTDALKKL